MRQGALKLAGMVGVVALAIAALVGGAIAQGTPPPSETDVVEPVKQVELTEKHIETFIAAQKAMTPLVQKAQDLPAGEQDPKLDAEFETVAKKHGFASYAEFSDIAANIMLILDGIDPSTGKFTDPITAIKNEIAEIEKDAKIPAKEKKEAIAERNAALKSFEPIKFPKNIELVSKWRKKIEEALQ